jgi:serine/threonine protein kinase
MKWLLGDIKPQNILMQCVTVPAHGTDADYSSAEIKLADFGLTKILDQHSATPSMSLCTVVGVLTGTMMYLFPEEFRGPSSGRFERSAADDLLRSACLDITIGSGLEVQKLMNAPDSLIIEALLSKASSELLTLAGQ